MTVRQAATYKRRMKRLLLPAGALVLVLTACGAGAKPAPRVAEVGARLSSVRVVAARRERAAMREAKRLLREFVPPPEAHRDRARRDHAAVLHRSAPGLLEETVDAHRFWSVRKPLAVVLSFVRAHDPKGFRRMGTSYGARRPRAVIRTLARPASRYLRPTRLLDETLVALPGRTVIRLDAEVAWVYPRAPTEVVPSATRTIGVRAPGVSLTVRNRAKVAWIIRWFDALPISPPGIAVGCPLPAPAHTTLSFRNADGTALARAGVPLYPPANVCNPIGFAIGGKRLQPLVDSDRGSSFILRLRRLLNLPLGRDHR